jgi:SAM-dependent methyltransferase
MVRPRHVPVRLLDLARSLGRGRVECPICSRRTRAFERFGAPPRAGALCPVCGSLERHRFLFLYLERRVTTDEGPLDLLHFAPEACLAALFSAREGVRYHSVDVEFSAAESRQDLTRLALRSASFDRVVCSHVLEHIVEDRAAMIELHRVLRPSGVAFVQVPLGREGRPTYEDPRITDPDERNRIFGQRDHVRIYGPDVRDRLAAAGFRVTVESCKALWSEQEIRRFGLLPVNAADDYLFVCQKPG